MERGKVRGEIVLLWPEEHHKKCQENKADQGNTRGVGRRNQREERNLRFAVKKPVVRPELRVDYGRASNSAYVKKQK
jgi:hypothetical protein